MNNKLRGANIPQQQSVPNMPDVKPHKADMRLIDYYEIRTLFSEKYKETVQLIRSGETHLDNLAEGFTEADRIIMALPAVDAVEVVRCKDCIYWENGKGYNPWCNHVSGLNDDVHGDYFCSYGERKEP